MSQTVERRQRRSDDPIVALHYQLWAVRAEAELETIVLVDDSGCMVAGAGAWAACEELAAFAPFLTHKQIACTAEVASQASEIANDTHVRTMLIDGAEALLCARGATNRDVTAPMVRAAAGCRRILGAEA